MPDWTAIREEYITGDISLRQLAEEHGPVDADTIREMTKELQKYKAGKASVKRRLTVCREMLLAIRKKVGD